MPLLTVEAVVAVYERGCINAQTMAKYMMNALNASDNDIDDARVIEFDKYFKEKMKIERDQLLSNVTATKESSATHPARDPDSGVGLSKKMRIEMERTGKIGSGNAK
jgi:hypothetical protein